MSHYISLVPVLIFLTAAVTTVVLVFLSVRGTVPGDRAGVLRAVAEVIRALRGRP
jgi:hypothetical protein